MTPSGKTVPLTRLLRRPEVERLTGLRRSTIYELMREGRFPKPIQLSKKSVAWVEAEINEWIAARIKASRSAVGEISNAHIA